MKVELNHKHKMAKSIEEKVILWRYDRNEETKEWERVYGTGHDVITLKVCECGHKEPINVERTKI